MAALIEPVEAAKYHFLALPVREEWGILMRADDPLAQRAGLQPAEVAALPLVMGRRPIVRDALADTLQLSPTELNLKVVTNLPGALPTLLKTGDYYHLGIRGVATQYHDPALAFVPLIPQTTSGHLLAWKKHRPLSPAATAFLQFITPLTING